MSAAAAGAVIGAEYEVLDNPDGALAQAIHEFASFPIHGESQQRV